MNETLTAELIKAANTIHKVSHTQIRSLIYRAIGEIRDLRVDVGIPGSGTSQDAVIRLLDTAARVEDHTDQQTSSALLEAADMIRTLRVIAASEVALRLRIHDNEGT